MTFQRRTAQGIIDLARSLKPEVKIVVGGYDPSLAPEAYQEIAVDYIVSRCAGHQICGGFESRIYLLAYH